MNILLANIPSVSISDIEEGLKNRRPLDVPISLNAPIGLLYIASYAKKYAQSRFDLRLLDINRELFMLQRGEAAPDAGDAREFLRRMISKAAGDFNPAIVGINIMFATSQENGILVSKAFRDLYPDALIVAGGCQATNTYADVLQKGAFDAVIRGEAETAFTELIDTYEPGKKKYSIRGLVGRDDLGTEAEAQKAVMIDDLDLIPPPDFSLLGDVGLYMAHSGRVRAKKDDIRALSIVTTRGCPMHCTFCASHSVHGRKIRARSLENIYDEIRHMVSAYNINTLIFEDDLVTYNRERTIKFCSEALKRRWNLSLEFPNGIAVWTLDETVVKMLESAGARVINLAVESGSPYVQQNIIRKKLDLKKVREVAEIIAGYPNIESRVYYVIGFPGETREHLNETMEFAKSLPVDWSVFNIAMPLPGSEMFDECVALGYIKRGANFDDFCKSYLHRKFDTKEFTKEELRKIHSDLNIHINFLSNRNILSGKYQRALPIFQKIVESYPFQIVARYCVWQCLKGLHMDEEARMELKDMRHWINHNERSRELYEQYGSLMHIPEGEETKD